MIQYASLVSFMRVKTEGGANRDAILTFSPFLSLFNKFTYEEN